MHLAETRYQAAYGTRAFSRSPLAHLGDLGFLGPEVSCAHGVWLTDDDLELVAGTGATICHNASSNLRLRSGIAQVPKMLERRVRVAIGIDSDGINDDNNMLQEVRLVRTIHRYPGLDRETPTSGELLRMATENGAAACMFGDRVGTLEVGRRADCVLIDSRKLADPCPVNPDVPLLDLVVQRAKPAHVDAVLVDGEVVAQHGRSTRLDEDQILGELRRALGRPLTPRELERQSLARALRPHIRAF